MSKKLRWNLLGYIGTGFKYNKLYYSSVLKNEIILHHCILFARDVALNYLMFKFLTPATILGSG